MADKLGIILVRVGIDVYIFMHVFRVHMVVSATWQTFVHQLWEFLKILTIDSIRIHPAIGIARLGNSPDEYFIGPEIPGDRSIPLEEPGDRLYSSRWL